MNSLLISYVYADKVKKDLEAAGAVVPSNFLMTQALMGSFLGDQPVLGILLTNIEKKKIESSISTGTEEEKPVDKNTINGIVKDTQQNPMTRIMVSTYSGHIKELTSQLVKDLGSPFESLNDMDITSKSGRVTLDVSNHTGDYTVIAILRQGMSDGTVYGLITSDQISGEFELIMDKRIVSSEVTTGKGRK